MAAAFLTAALMAAAQVPANMGQPAPPPVAAATMPYAETADRALAAPVAAVATIDRATRLRGARAEGVPAGHSRFFVEATITSLLKSPGGLAAQTSYLVDVPNDARGRAPRLRDLQVILLGRTVPGRPGELQLIGSDGQIAWTPGDEAQVRAILTEAASAAAPPEITGIASAYHVAGTVRGESETQVFLTTGDARPVSLSVLRRPGEDTRWAVSLTEIVDEAARAPRPGTLLHYRLACGLPRALPDRVLDAADPAAAEGARRDYRFVLESLGPCRPGAAGV